MVSSLFSVTLEASQRLSSSFRLSSSSLRSRSSPLQPRQSPSQSRRRGEPQSTEDGFAAAAVEGGRDGGRAPFGGILAGRPPSVSPSLFGGGGESVHRRLGFTAPSGGRGGGAVGQPGSRAAAGLPPRIRAALGGRVLLRPNSEFYKARFFMPKRHHFPPGNQPSLLDDNMGWH